MTTNRAPVLPGLAILGWVAVVVLVGVVVGVPTACYLLAGMLVVMAVVRAAFGAREIIGGRALAIDLATLLGAAAVLAFLAPWGNAVAV
ncbi:hypothetical protein [Georgenia sp. Z1491]|uniref:hypothetical protein n=1 Tax=Georgenia sp. Z1491 TaxID=3416707 RepID=UPI003CF3023B